MTAVELRDHLIPELGLKDASVASTQHLNRLVRDANAALQELWSWLPPDLTRAERTWSLTQGAHEVVMASDEIGLIGPAWIDDDSPRLVMLGGWDDLLEFRRNRFGSIEVSDIQSNPLAVYAQAEQTTSADGTLRYLIFDCKSDRARTVTGMAALKPTTIAYVNVQYTSPTALTLNIPANYAESLLLPLVRLRFHVANPWSIATEGDKADIANEAARARDIMRKLTPPRVVDSRIRRPRGW